MLFSIRKLQPLFYSAIEAGIFTKAVAGFLLPGGERKILAFGVPKDAIFDLASLTKVCPTSTIALKLVLEKKLGLDDRVVNYIPELKTNFRNEILVRHLLTHSLDYRVPMSTLWQRAPEDILNFLFEYQFNARPGTVFNYGNPASILLGIVLSRITGKDLQKLGQEMIFGPLKMTRSGFNPLSKFKPSEIVPTEICPDRGGALCGEVHDESAFTLKRLFPVGSAGMFSCVPDLLNFLETLLYDGDFYGKRIFPQGILNLISQNALEGRIAHECTALGFELNAAKFMGTKHSDRTFGKTGFTGSSIVGDAEKGAGFVLLSNFTWPHREQNADRINTFRALLSDTFFSLSND